MLDSTVVCRRALGCEWGVLDGTYLKLDDDSRTTLHKGMKALLNIFYCRA